MNKSTYSDSPLMRKPNLPSTTNQKSKWSGWLSKSSIVGGKVTSKESSANPNQTSEKEREEKDLLEAAISDVTISETVVSESDQVVDENVVLPEDESINILNQFKCCEELLKKIKSQFEDVAVEEVGQNLV